MIKNVDVLLLKHKLHRVIKEPLLLDFKRLTRYIWILQLLAHLDSDWYVLKNWVEVIALQCLLFFNIQTPQVLQVVSLFKFVEILASLMRNFHLRFLPLL